MVSRIRGRFYPPHKVTDYRRLFFTDFFVGFGVALRNEHDGVVAV
jgi:hypothetical protein